MDPVIAIRTQATYLAGPALGAQSEVQIAVTVLLLLASVTDWYLFPLSRNGNTVSS